LAVANTFFLKGVFRENFLLFGFSQHLLFVKVGFRGEFFIYGLAVANTFFFERGF